LQQQQPSFIPLSGVGYAWELFGLAYLNLPIGISTCEIISFRELMEKAYNMYIGSFQLIFISSIDNF